MWPELLVPYNSANEGGGKESDMHVFTSELLLPLLILQHYNPRWVLAFSATFFHSFLFLVNSFQFFKLSTSRSLRIPSIYLFLGLPADLLPNAFAIV
jgi:hypothetical protein